MRVMSENVDLAVARQDNPSTAGDKSGGARVRSRSQAEDTYQVLRREILSCSIAPGSKILIGDICARLGFSSGAVREALSRLSAEGLAVAEPQKGFRATRYFHGGSDGFDLRSCASGVALPDGGHGQGRRGLGGKCLGRASRLVTDTYVGDARFEVDERRVRASPTIISMKSSPPDAAVIGCCVYARLFTNKASDIAGCLCLSIRQSAMSAPNTGRFAMP